MAGAVNAPHASVRTLSYSQPRRAAGHNDTGKNQQRHAVADAAFGNLLTQPHDEDTARGQRQHRHQDETDAGIEYEIARLLQADGDAEGLDRAEHDCQIAGPLRDLFAASSPSFCNLASGS